VVDRRRRARRHPPDARIRRREVRREAAERDRQLLPQRRRHVTGAVGLARGQEDVGARPPLVIRRRRIVEAEHVGAVAEQAGAVAQVGEARREQRLDRLGEERAR
jgi:hypothetical protein